MCYIKIAILPYGKTALVSEKLQCCLYAGCVIFLSPFIHDNKTMISMSKKTHLSLIIV